MSNDTDQIKNEPTLGQALTPVALLVGLLASSVYLFGDSSSSGPNQIALILAAGLTILIGLRNGYTWKEMEQGMVHGISLAMGALMMHFILETIIAARLMGIDAFTQPAVEEGKRLAHKYLADMKRKRGP